MPIWPVLLAVLLLLIGGFLFIRGLIGRPIDDHPICRRCKFDLFGLPPGSTMCSECGADLTPLKSIRFGNRRRQTGMALLGASLLAPALFGLGLIAWGAINDVNWIEHAPYWYVLREFNSPVASDRAIGLIELSRRLSAKELSDPQVDTITDAALALQADTKSPWIPQLGEFIETARSMRLLSDEKWEQYFRNAVQYQLFVRPQVRRGDALIASINQSFARCGPRLQIYCWNETTLASSDLVDPKKNYLGGRNNTGSMSANSSGSRGHSIVLDPKLVAAAPDGPKTLRMSLKMDYYEQMSNGKIPPVVSKTIPLEATWNLVPATAVTVTPIDDPTVRAAVEKSIEIKAIAMNSNGGSDYVSLSINTAGTPVPLAYKLILRSQQREWPIGSMTVRGNGNSGWGIAGQAKGLDADVVDVILRPDLEAAINTVDMTQYWNGEVVIKDVKVIRPSPASKPASSPSGAR